MISTTTSGMVDSGFISGSKVTAIETTTVCYIDPAKSGQPPTCSIKRVRVLEGIQGESGEESPVATAASVAADGNDKTGPIGKECGPMCPVSSNEQTQEEQVDEMVDCMLKSKENEHTVSHAPKQNFLNNKRRFSEKGDAL